jgi:hypothetical protein
MASRMVSMNSSRLLRTCIPALAGTSDTLRVKRDFASTGKYARTYKKLPARKFLSVVRTPRYLLEEE